MFKNRVFLTSIVLCAGVQHFKFGKEKNFVRLMLIIIEIEMPSNINRYKLNANNTIFNQ